ncbi:TPA: PTS sugar transporter subunit IIA, partial [Salmonella enterica subsp. indica]|nr:PTS sugar transporter subunit IIA [Salmonella enterica subsp. indica]
MTTLTANCIDLNIQGNSVYAILKQLANMTFQNGYVSERSAYLQTLLMREKLHST